MSWRRAFIRSRAVWIGLGPGRGVFCTQKRGGDGVLCGWVWGLRMRRKFRCCTPMHGGGQCALVIGSCRYHRDPPQSAASDRSLYEGIIFSLTVLTSSPLSALFCQVGSLIRQVRSLIRHSLRSQLSGNHDLGLPRAQIRHCCFPLQN